MVYRMGLTICFGDEVVSDTNIAQHAFMERADLTTSDRNPPDRQHLVSIHGSRCTMPQTVHV